MSDAVKALAAPVLMYAKSWCPYCERARDLLQRALGLKVSIEDKNGRGRVIIEYSRLEDFDALLETIAGK